jgi:Spy/CpxP family protein refolding chaperone
MKKVIITAVAILLATAAIHVVAQPHPGAGAAEMRQHITAAEQYLGLSDAQKASWEAAVSDVESQNAATMAKAHTAQKQLNEALSAASPDACNVGNLAIQAHAAMDQLKSAHESLIGKLASYLTADQKAKFDAYVAAAMAQHREPGPPPMK